MAIEIVDFPIKNGGSFHCYVSSPEGIDFGLFSSVELMELVELIAWCLTSWGKNDADKKSQEG